MTKPKRRKRSDMMARALIVFDGKSWFVRMVALVEHDMSRDEMVYRCDKPVGRAFRSPRAALYALLSKLEAKK